MPVETMDRRNTPSFYKPAVPSSLFSGEIRIPSEKHIGFWKTASMSDHHGLAVITNMSGGKPASSFPLENMKNNILDNIELSQNFSKEQKGNIHFDKPLIDPLKATNSQRTPNIHAASQKVDMKTGYYENSLFSSSMSDLFNRTRGLTSKDDLVHQLANTAQSNLVVDEPFKCSEEIEVQAIGDLLPDDNDLFFDAIHNQGPAPQSNWTDAEDDLFCSVGGLELEPDDNTKFLSQIDYSGIFNSQEGGSKKPLPSRMLVVGNVDSNIDDAKLKILLEQFGDLQAFHTFYRHQCIVVASYYDIRAAQNAEKMLQAIRIMGKKPDIQFYVSKEILFGNQTCDGAVQITNIDISNDEVLHIFSRYGEIKDICEIPQNRQYKVVEFYDVRAADAALSALNGYEVGGKRIKVEPLRLRDSRLSSMRKSTMDIEFDETGKYRQEIYPETLPSECYGTCSGHQNGVDHGSISTINFGMSSNIPHKIPSQSTSSVTEKSNSLYGNYEPSHSHRNRNLCSQSMPSFPKINGVVDGMNMNSSLVANGDDSRSINISGSYAHFEHNKSGAYSCGIGSFTPVSHQHNWNGSLAWQNMQPFVYRNSIPIQTPHMVFGRCIGPPHIPNQVMTPNHHVGSAPCIAFHPKLSPLHLYDFSSQNTLDSSASSTREPRAHIHRTKSNVLTSRGRRSNSNVNQSDSSSQYDLDIDGIACGEERRTTLMIKNIPNKYTSKMLLATIDEQHKGAYDFIYLPIDFKNKCNVGYAFINMTDPQHIIPFYQVFNGKKWEKFNSGKVAYLAYARIQGKSALIGHFQNSSLMNEDKRCRPVLFRTEGPNAGEQEPFPVPSTRIRRSRTTTTKTNLGSMSGSSSDDDSPNSTKDFE